MRRTGPDSVEGWFIALMCCLISTMMFGAAGLSGMLFVACITRYNTDRNQAAFPFILSNVLQAATGPFAGYFAKKFGIRTVVLAGSVLGFIGIGTCFFAESITAVTVLWGIVFGTGFGFSTLLLPAIINNYFFKHRSKALGLSYLGSPIGFLIFPIIFEILLNYYGLSGTFLFLSGINLHCLLFSLFLKDPSFKDDSANLPLNQGKEQVTYLSTDSRTIIQNGRPEFENGKIENREKISMKNFGLRRFSLEFLWKNPTLQKTTENEQYILTLSKPDSNVMHRKSKYLRSFEESSRSYYGHFDQRDPKKFKLDELEFPGKGCICDKVKSKPGKTFHDSSRHLNCTEKEGIYISHGFDNFDEFANIELEYQSAFIAEPSVNAKDINSNSKEVDHEFKKFGSLKHLNNYSEFSTICFSANQRTCSLARGNHEPNLNYANGKGNAHNCCIHSLTNPMGVSHTKTATVSSNAGGEIENGSNSPKACDCDCDEEKRTSTPRWFTYFKNKSVLNMYCNPVFIVMSIANAIFNLQFSTLTTVIIDFSRDHSIDPDCEKFIMMCISIMGACGMVGFGWVTDGGYMSRHRFASLCLLIGSISTAVLPLTVGFETLMFVLAAWCLSQSCFVVLIPAIIADYFEEDIQAVAVSACNVLCAPLYLIIPPLIGYFRDGKGSYDYIFYLLSILSLLNSIAVFIVPYLSRLKRKQVNHETF